MCVCECKCVRVHVPPPVKLDDESYFSLLPVEML